MIKLNVSQTDKIEIWQRDEEPSIYFDHWALRIVSESNFLSDSIVKIIKAKNGTLCISWLSLLEFSEVSECQCKQAEVFLNTLLPNIIFINPNPFEVIEIENERIKGITGPSPHLEPSYSEVLLCSEQTSQNPLTFNRLLEYSTAKELGASRENLAKTIIQQVGALRGEMAGNRKFAQAVKSYIHQPIIGPRLTRQVVREALRNFLIDPSVPFTANHAFDLLHAVVPVSYCNFVLLDSHWQNLVERARTRLTNQGINLSLAQVYSKKNNGIEIFLGELKKF